MKVLMLVSSPLLTDPRVYNEAQSLINASYEVTVLAWDREKNAPEHQVLDGIDVFRMRTPVPFDYGMAKVPRHAFHMLSWFIDIIPNKR